MKNKHSLRWTKKNKQQLFRQSSRSPADLYAFLSRAVDAVTMVSHQDDVDTPVKIHLFQAIHQHPNNSVDLP